MKFIIEESKLFPSWWTVIALFNDEPIGFACVQRFNEALDFCETQRQQVIAKLTETK